ncbi:Os02g0658350 [Oryza sativa Japonica Group]|uniref:Uncharacterized protein n=2 Tax=Oryza sativa subsp. japonica TaxID=39947 RepID=Q6H6B7_ORYSJ|nr:hypothetical protein [Oryza sativa Japonica Group]BAD25769.1 hypothetical protein [Oryza sativa Japonica Group]BAS80120.1 Os02g0658350 [Oryza sativa Japonica Group]
MQVKDVIARCLEARLSKGQMFRQFRRSKIDPVIYYAVYKELRSQNEEFFELFMLKVSLKRQIDRVNHHLALCRKLWRQANESAGGHRCGNSSCSGGHRHRAVAVPVPHAEATPRAMPSTPLAVPLPATAMAQRTQCNLARMPRPQQPNCGGRPGSSRGGAVGLSAAGRMLETPGQPHVAPNGWPAGHGHPASGTLAAAMACSSRPVARQQGNRREQGWDAHQAQVGAQHQNLPRFPPQQGGGNIGERQGQGQFRPGTPSYVQEQRPPPQSSSSHEALQAGERQQANNNSSGSSRQQRQTDTATVASRREPMSK